MEVIVKLSPNESFLHFSVISVFIKFRGDSTFVMGLFQGIFLLLLSFLLGDFKVFYD